MTNLQRFFLNCRKGLAVPSAYLSAWELWDSLTDYERKSYRLWLAQSV